MTSKIGGGGAYGGIFGGTYGGELGGCCGGVNGGNDGGILGGNDGGYKGGKEGGGGDGGGLEGGSCCATIYEFSPKYTNVIFKQGYVIFRGLHILEIEVIRRLKLP